ncbi:NUDIX domain-containing protein [Acinetobacter tianfuensis]|uniref:ADP-ribose pyrophosphatase n=1 Tax=Acinetobacter tianfuensis TaxID=2419603 RepID=A0A3A8EXF7_9GAMM|nr:NUDIX domain-containing protein [Acinetobacter tianfuensis]RKG33551.1 NUDIX domain-containing protein [Acinetobacter tianfuensis]
MNIIKQASYNNQDFAIEGRETVFKGFIQVEKVSLRYRLFNQDSYSNTLQRELIRRKEAAGVLLYSHSQQKFALIEQFRIGAIEDTESAWQLEIIAGVLDGDESPESCIRRESLEESGCQIDQLQHLFSFYPSAGACSELFHLYSAATVLPDQGGIFGMPEEGENIQLHILNYSDLPALMTSGRLKNAPVIMALQWLQMHIDNMKNV